MQHSRSDISPSRGVVQACQPTPDSTLDKARSCPDRTSKNIDSTLSAPGTQVVPSSVSRGRKASPVGKAKLIGEDLDLGGLQELTVEGVDQ